MANGFDSQEDRSDESTEKTNSFKYFDDGCIDNISSEDQVGAAGRDSVQESIDKETQLDCLLLQYFENGFSSQVPEQLSVDFCYGRGKFLADITLPRLPEKLQDGSYIANAFSSVDNLDQLVLQSQINKELLAGCGRGKILKMQSNFLDHHVQEVRPMQNIAGDESPLPVSPVKSSSSIYEDNLEDFDMYQCAKPVQSNSYNFKSLEDFPSLASQNSVDSRPAQTLYSKQVRQRSCQNVLKTVHVYEDAEESVTDVAQHNSQTSNTPLDSQVTYSNGCSNITQTDCNNELKHQIGEKDDSSMSAVENAICHNSQKMHEYEPYDGVQAVCHQDDLHGSPQNDLNPDKAVEDSDSLTTTADTHTLISVASATVAENKHSVEDCSQSTENYSNQASGTTSELENQVASKPKKKKVPGSWKLEGEGVIHVENVPKGRGEELRMHLAGFGKIVEKEKKSQKGGNIWRFRFKDADKCDYAISCVDGYDLFEGNLPPLACRRLEQTPEDDE